ncbi:hypothetical protein [Sporosarcina sp. FSL W7-1283]|uniref:hypothetical protein n=1 Tax=Sporosarcina sp. FSL W7-1283 TaxID=2921560 RepID=UPI0030FBB335
MNKYFKENEYVYRVCISLAILILFVAVSTFSVFNTLERNRQHDANIIELNQEAKKQQDLRIKQETLYDEMLDYYKQLKVTNKKGGTQ